MTHILDGQHGIARPNTTAGRLQRAAYDLLMEHDANDEIPTNGRFLFYELEGRGVVHKIEPPKRRGTASKPGPMELTEATVVLRQLGIIPWDWIVDETRSLTEWYYADSVAEYMADRLGNAKINPWDSEPPLLLVESRSLGGVLKSMVSQYCVPIAATNGQVGGFLHTDIAPLLKKDTDRPVIYMGDLDHQGEQIEDNTRAVLEQECGERLDWTRIALTHAQVEERDIRPLVKFDKRYKPPLRMEAWECESLGQGTIVSLVREALDDLLPRTLESVREREGAERRAIEKLLRGTI